MDKFSFKQIIILILVIFGCTMLFGFSLMSCVGDSTVVVQDCPAAKHCSTVTVRFHNMQAVPKDTLNATAVKIIHGLNRADK